MTPPALQVNASRVTFSSMLSSCQLSSVKHLVLDFFTGMGGLGYAMESNGIKHEDHGVLQLMFECDATCRKLLQHHRVSAQCLLSDIEDSTGCSGSCFAVLDMLDDFQQVLMEMLPPNGQLLSILVAGGHPCKGNSKARTVPQGSADPESQKVIIFPMVIGRLLQLPLQGVKIVHMIENVKMDANPEVKESATRITAVMKVEPVELDSRDITAGARPRTFWSNLIVPPLTPVQCNAQLVLRDHWKPLWELNGQVKPDCRFATFLRGFPPGQPPEVDAQFKSFHRLPLHCYSEKGLVFNSQASASELATIKQWVSTHVNIKTSDLRDIKSSAGRKQRQLRGQLARWIHVEGGRKLLRPLDARERERVLGFPPLSSALPDDPTDVTSDDGHYVHHQMQATGNSFSVPVVAHVIRPWCSWVINGGELAMHSGLPSIFEKNEVLKAILPSGSPAGGQQS